MEKRVNVRIEHIKHSNCRLEFLERVKANKAKKEEAKKNGQPFNLKRAPLAPRTARYVSTKNNAPVTISPVPYEALI
jgi:large subunit ribosomal protein L21e